MAEEQLSGCADQTIFEAGAGEKRCLITLALDFSDILRFPPESGAGVVILRIAQSPTLDVLEQLVRSFLDLPNEETSSGSLWIVEPVRIRVRTGRRPEE